MDKTVKTIDGTFHPKDKCRRIGGQYYLIGDNTVENSGQVYLIGEKYYKFNTGYIVYDHRVKEYVIKSSALIEGIVGLDDKEDLVFGYFSIPGDISLCLATARYNNANWYILDYKVFENSNNWVYSPSYEQYRRRKGLRIKDIFYINVDSDYKYNLPYTIDNNTISQVTNIFDSQFKVDKKKYKDTMLYLLGPLFSKYSFGVEFETVRGKIPNFMTNANGLVPLRDGSIQGLEYVTIPHYGTRGLLALKESCNLLSKYAVDDKSCSLHIHLGGFPRKKKELLALFKVLCAVENDMYDMFPIYKKDNHGIKKKAYTKPLPSSSMLSAFDPIIKTEKQVNENFDLLFHYLSMGKSMVEYEWNLDNVTCHPQDPGNSSKWNMKTRYHWVNLLPIIFGNKKTVEFRIHSSTYNFNNIIPFMIICACILEYSAKYVDTILGNRNYLAYISLRDVIREIMYKNNLFIDAFSSRSLNDLDQCINEYVRGRERFISTKLKQGVIDPKESEFFYAYSQIWTKKYSSGIKSKMESMAYTLSDLEGFATIANDSTGNFTIQSGQQWVEVTTSDDENNNLDF